MKVTQIGLLLLVGLIGYGLGRRIWRTLRVRFSSSLEEVILSLALGWGGLAYLVLGIGVCGLLHRGIAYGLIGVLTLISIPEIRAFRRNPLEAVPPAASAKSRAKLRSEAFASRAFTLSLWLLLAVTLTVSLMGALTPPLNYDTLSYHLGAPKEYIRHQRIIYLPHQVYSNFPFTLEMLYLLSLLLKGDILAKLIHFSFGILTAAAIYSFGRRYFSPRAALLSSAIFYNLPLVAFLSTTAYIDLGATLYGFLALGGMVNWFYSKERGDFLTSAIFSGLAMGTKYPAILFSFLPLLLGIVFKMSLIDLSACGHAQAGRSRWTSILKRAAVFSLLAIGVASPWFIKNLILTGNPLYPLFYDLLGGKDWNAFNGSRFMKQHSPSFENWREAFLLPLTLSKSKGIGPLFITFAPLMIFFRRFERPIKLLLIYGGWCFFMWAFFTHHDERFILPAFPGFCLAGGYLLTHFGRGRCTSLLLTAGAAGALTLSYPRLHLLGLWLLSHQTKASLILLSFGLSVLLVLLIVHGRSSKSFSSLIVAGLALLMLVNLSEVVGMVPKYGLLRAAFGREPREEFLSRNLYAYDAFRFANEKLPPSAKILLIGENQGYYLDRPYVANSPLDDNIIVGIVNSSPTAGEIRERLKEMGITHVLYNVSEAKRVAFHYSSFNWADEEAEKRFFSFLSQGEHLRLIFSRSGVFIYEVL